MRIITPSFVVDNIDLVQKNSPAVDELNITCKSTSNDQIIVATFDSEYELNITWNDLWIKFSSEDTFSFIGHKCETYYNNEVVSTKSMLTTEEKLLKEISDSLKSITNRPNNMRVSNGENFMLRETMKDIADALWYAVHKIPMGAEPVKENQLYTNPPSTNLEHKD